MSVIKSYIIVKSLKIRLQKRTRSKIGKIVPLITVAIHNSDRIMAVFWPYENVNIMSGDSIFNYEAHNMS